jgi:hypothetical protein
MRVAKARCQHVRMAAVGMLDLCSFKLMWLCDIVRGECVR